MIRATTTRRWHGRLAWLLSVPLFVWLVTALGMALVPRSWTTAYPPPPTSFDATQAWPRLDELVRVLDESASQCSVQLLRLERRGKQSVLEVFDSEWDEQACRQLVTSTDAVSPWSDAEPLASEEMRLWAAELTGEDLATEVVSLVERHSPKYQKLRLPAYRVQAGEATLFFDPITGELVHQATRAHVFEDLMKTVHTWDWTGGAVFEHNRVLTTMALLFLVTAMLGVISIRRLAILRGPGRGLAFVWRAHQVLGGLLFAQVLIWVLTGLSVVWLLRSPGFEGVSHVRDDSAVIDATRVRVHPAQLPWAEETAGGPPARVELATLQGEPVYRLRGPGRIRHQQLHSAVDGRAIEISVAMRTRIAEDTLTSPASIERWQRASGPAELDYYFFAGPWPVWKAWYSSPSAGVLSIDATTGQVYPPRTRRAVWLERLYKLHVLDWTGGVISYRLEPVLIVGILLMSVLLATGVWFQVGRWRRGQRRASVGGTGERTTSPPL